MYKNFIVVAFVLLATLVQAQKEYTVKVFIDEFPNSKVMLAGFYGDKNSIVDTAETDVNGNLTFIFPDDRPAGMYRMFLTKKKFADFIFDKEDIELRTEYDFPMDSMKVVSSWSNKKYYGFLHAEHDFNIKLELLSPVVSYFPKDDDFYNEVVTKFNNLQKERDNYILESAAEKDDSYVSKIILFQRTPMLPKNISEKEKNEYMRNHFFDKINFDDAELLRSDVYPTKLINFLSLFGNRNFTQEELENSFIKGMDILMSKPFDNLLVKEYVTEYMLKGFEQYGLERVIAHIAETYNDDKACENEERKSDLQTRLDNYKKLAIGKIAPDIKISDADGNIIRFDEIESNYVMLIFWANWCPHCTQMIPEIKKMYDNQKKKNIEVLAISLDKEKDAWKKYISDEKLSWINACDLKSWSSKVVSDYNIYATPTIILLDRKNREILSKPITLQAIQKEFDSRQ
ncbi:MAG: thioredoxin-like domain-containing protein [Bacteroidota bacterium]|nr:thioredoxin-like domain-containing protein [Bacteroidota bacterium]